MSKIVLLDVETLPAVAATFSLYPESINHDNLLSDQSIICVCWKLLEKKAIYSTSILDDPKRFKKDVNDDYVVMKKIREVLEDVDIAIGHNIKKFDIKKINARLIFHGLTPLPSGLIMLDTLTEVRKVASFLSNRLDYLGKHLTGGGKQETSRGLWLRVLKGDKDAVKEMVTYCKRDVQVLEDVYLRLRPYMKNHPVVEPEFRQETCHKCGSDQLSKKMTRHTATGVKKQQVQCKICHGYTTFIYKGEE